MTRLLLALMLGTATGLGAHSLQASRQPPPRQLAPTPGAGAEVTTWVPPYQLQQSRASLQHTVGGIAAGDWITRIGLQFWLPSPDGSLRFAERGEPL